MLGVLIVVGLYRVFFRDLGPIPLSELSEEARELAAGTATLSLFMLLRAFSSGSGRAFRRRGRLQWGADVP